MGSVTSVPSGQITGEVVFSKALSRSVTGSMNDLIFHAKMWMVEVELSPFDASFKLNEMPMSALGYRKPQGAFRRLCDVLRRQDRTPVRRVDQFTLLTMSNPLSMIQWLQLPQNQG